LQRAFERRANLRFAARVKMRARDRAGPAVEGERDAAALRGGETPSRFINSAT
jgi:hypothetical protein